MNVEGCRGVFSAVDADRELADAQRAGMDRTVESAMSEAKSSVLHAALMRLRDETLVPAMESVVDRVDAVTCHGSAAVSHVVQGDAQMAQQSQTSAGLVVHPSMPGHAH